MAHGNWKLRLTETRWYKYCGVNPIWNKLMWSKMFSLWGSTSCSMYNEWNDNTGDIRQSIPISITSLKYAFGRWFILFCRESFAIRQCANVNRARHIMLFSFNWWPRVEEYWHHTKGLSHYINRLFEQDKIRLASMGRSGDSLFNKYFREPTILKEGNYFNRQVTWNN